MPSAVQAIYRAYRFGQTQRVRVYRFLAHGTMEEKIYRSQVCCSSRARAHADRTHARTRTIALTHALARAQYVH